MKMTIEEIKKEKAIAEQKIKEIIQDLADRTGMVPLNLDIQAVDARTAFTNPGENITFIASVSLRLEIP